MKMNRFAVVIAGGALLAAAPSLAALDATHQGLPDSFTMTTAQGYGTVATGGNEGSAMCVECHSINPSEFIRDVSSNGALTVDRTNAAHRGSHAVMNDTASGTAGQPWGVTNSGGGFVGGFGNAARDNGEYFRGVAWDNGGESKFNDDGATNGLSSAFEVTDTVTVATADLICESCHNLIQNTNNAANDNDLLLGVYQDNVEDELCLGCHAQNETTGTAAYGAFHGNDNLPAFAGTSTRKRHHVLTGDSLINNVTHYGNPPNGTNSIMWAPTASDRLGATWCTTAYGARGTATELDLVAGVTIAFRNACNVAGQGSRVFSQPQSLGDVVVADSATITCTNCHRPHNAMSTAGAFIFRLGNTASTDFTGQVGTGNFTGTTNADPEYGLRRQSDVGSYGTKLYTEYVPLCAGCHYGYGQ